MASAAQEIASPSPCISETLPAAAEVTSIAPSITPNRTGVRIIHRRCRIHARCRIDRIFVNHHWRRRYNDVRVWRRSPVCVWGNFLLIAWIFAIGSYLQIGGHCRRGKSQCTCCTQDRFTHLRCSLVCHPRSEQTREHVVRSMTGISNAFSAAYSNRDRPVDVEQRRHSGILDFRFLGHRRESFYASAKLKLR